MLSQVLYNNLEKKRRYFDRAFYSAIKSHVTGSKRVRLESFLLPIYIDCFSLFSRNLKIPDELYEVVKQRSDLIYENKYNLPLVISRTEATTAANFGSLSRALYSGLKNKIWISNQDSGSRHKGMNGEKVSIDAKFSNGLLYPGDPKGNATQIINCRCFLAFV